MGSLNERLKFTVLFGILWIASVTSAAVEFEVYSTFNSAGISVDIATSDDPDANALASVSYRQSSVDTFQEAMPLTRVSATRFVGSLFNLKAGTAYTVRVRFEDDGVLSGLAYTQSTTTRTEIFIPSATTTHHVSSSGSGPVCTQNNPCSLSQGLNNAGPGEHVVLSSGVYYSGGLSMPRSGTASAPIVIRATSGASVVLDGADPNDFIWESVGGGVYRTAVPYSDVHLVVANDTRLLAYQSLVDLQTLYWDVPGSFTDGTHLWVRLAQDQNPNSASISVSRYNSAFLVEQDYIYFSQLTFRHYGYSSYAKAIYFNNASGNVVTDCTFRLNDSGVSIKRLSHRNVIQDSYFSDDIFDWPWDAIKESTRSDPITEAGAVEMFSPVTGRGNIIRRNRLQNMFDGIGTCPASTSGVINETDVHDNHISEIADDGITADGTCSNVRIWNNKIHNALVGISMAPSQVGPTFALRNLIYNTGAGNNSFPGTAFKFNSGDGPSGSMYLFHNTVDAQRAATSAIEIKSPGSWTNIKAVNNIWLGTDFAIENYNTSQPTDFLNNVLFSISSNRLVRWSGVDYSELASFQTATGNELQSLQLHPSFRDVSAADYRLSAASSLRDAAMLIPGVNANYQGNAPDIGAFEFVENADTVVEGEVTIGLLEVPKSARPGGDRGGVISPSVGESVDAVGSVPLDR